MWYLSSVEPSCQPSLRMYVRCTKFVTRRFKFYKNIPLCAGQEGVQGACWVLRQSLILWSLQDVVLMRALRDMNLPKFVFEDVPLFLGLISDLFPGLDCPRVRYPDFNDAVEQVLEENGYVLLPVQVSRVLWNSHGPGTH